jgi:hypothetical protein
LMHMCYFTCAVWSMNSSYTLLSFLPSEMQAKALVWADLSADQLERLRSPQKGASARELLAKFLGFTDPSSHTQAILLDMYTYTLQFGQVMDVCSA